MIGSTINNQNSTINNFFRVFPELSGLECRKVNKVMFRAYLVVIVFAALSFTALSVGQNARDPLAGPAGADQPPSPEEVVKAMGDIAAPKLPPVRPRSAKLAPGSLTNEQVKQLINQVAEKDIQNDKVLRNYTYTERQEEHKLDGKGQVKSTETETHEIMVLYGEQVERLVAKNDKPLSEKEQKKQDEKIQKIIDKRKNETDEERKKRLEKEEKDREHDREFVRDVGDAYNFNFLGIEPMDDRDTYVIDAEPRPGFVPQHKDAKYLPKFRFRIWIDAAEKEWVKLDAQCVDTVSWGLFLARVHKGSRVVIENTRVNDEVWLPKYVQARLDARLALLKEFNMDFDITYRDYKKFRTDTKIVGMGEVVEGK